VFNSDPGLFTGVYRFLFVIVCLFLNVIVHGAVERVISGLFFVDTEELVVIGNGRSSWPLLVALLITVFRDLEERESCLCACLEDHLREVTSVRCDGLITLIFDHEAVWVVELAGLAVRHHKNPVGVDNRCQSVGNDEHRACAETLLKLALDEVVRLQVNVGCGFVKNENLCLAYDCTCQTNELLLANGKQVVRL